MAHLGDMSSFSDNVSSGAGATVFSSVSDRKGLLMNTPALFKRCLIGLGLIIAIGFALVYGFGLSVLRENQNDLIYLGLRHLYLVGVSMALALGVGLPCGILLSRPRM